MRDDEMVFPHELRIGDVIELAGSSWRLVRKPLTRVSVKSIEVALEHVGRRGETMLWPLDQRQRVKRINDA